MATDKQRVDDRGTKLDPVQRLLVEGKTEAELLRQLNKRLHNADTILVAQNQRAVKSLISDKYDYLVIDIDSISARKELLKQIQELERKARFRTTSAIVTPPGFRLTAVLSFLLTRKAFARYVAPVIADMQEEYIDALHTGHAWHARWIWLRGHFLVIPGWLYAFIAGKLPGLLRRGQ
jgi:hypothetical protein